MPYPWAAGNQLTATDLNAAIDRVRCKRQTASQTVNNSITLVNSNDLIFAVKANTKYMMDSLIIYDSNITADFKIKFSVPSGTSVRVSPWCNNTGTDTITGALSHDAIDADNFAAGGVGAGTMITMRPSARITVGSTAGNMVVQFAQNTANITATEYRDLVSAGVAVALVYENTAGDARGGYDAGVTGARLARADADAIGFPRNRPIYMAIDDVNASDYLPACMAYLDGAASVLGRDCTGVYGFRAVVAEALRQGKARWAWQCGSWSALVAGVHLYQRNNDTTTVGGIAGDAANANAYSFRMQQMLAVLQTSVATLAATVAGDALTAEQLTDAVAAAIRDNVVTVDVSVHGQPTVP